MLDLEPLLAQSGAPEAFKDDVRAFARHLAAERVVVAPQAPRVKVLRVLAQLLAAEPALLVERVRVSGHSGCCDFRGTLVVTANGGDVTYEFTWDCRWRAEVEGWVDRWGGADQVRAAREFGWRCFSRWVRREPPRPATAPPHAPTG